MKPRVILPAVWMVLSAGISLFAQQATPGKLPVLVPESAGKNPCGSHTHLRVVEAGEASQASASQFNTPDMLRSVYSLPSYGGSGAIAIVDAFYYPTAVQDFNNFSAQFGLPLETSNHPLAGGNKVFQVVYATGKQPFSGGNYIGGWNLEEALDIEWAHAIAPNAKIYLVEAATDSLTDMMNAVQVASRLPGVREVSMSWGSSETAIEVAWYDRNFSVNGVVYLAAGGDSSDTVEYPATSSNVISCGGTTIHRDFSGNFIGETGWAFTGCGLSRFEPRPSYQNSIAAIVGQKRGVNDMAFDADPSTGVYVYDSTPFWGESGWWVVGGTSVATPCLAGVINLAAALGNGFAGSTAAEQTRIYGNMKNSNAFRDITSGVDGVDKSAVGWDFITGVGSPVGLSGK
jgi:kumamolisin